MPYQKGMRSVPNAVIKIHLDPCAYNTMTKENESENGTKKINLHVSRTYYFPVSRSP